MQRKVRYITSSFGRERIHEGFFLKHSVRETVKSKQFIEPSEWFTACWQCQEDDIWVIAALSNDIYAEIPEKCKESHARSRRLRTAPFAERDVLFIRKSDYWIPSQWNVFREKRTDGKKKKSLRIRARQQRRDRIYDVESRSGEFVSPSNKRRRIFSHPKWHEHTNYFVRVRKEGKYEKMDVLSRSAWPWSPLYAAFIYGATHGEAVLF